MLRRFSILSCALALITPASGGVTLEIHHLWEGKPLALPTGELTTSSGEKIDLTRLSYLLSEPRLLRRGDNNSSGNWIQRKNWFAFIDASQGVSSVSLGGLPKATYTTLQFHIGPDEKTDQADPNQYPAKHPLNPVLNNLHWTPQGGYIYLALEGHLRDNKETGGFAYHLGNTWNRMAITLPASFNTEHDATVVLEFHVDRLFNTAPALKIAERSSTHSRKNDLVASTLKQRIEGAFTLRAIRQDKAVSPNPSATPPRKLVGTPYRFRVARGFPIPELPSDFPLTNERVKLGGLLFHENLLSRNNTQSCASCHQPSHALSDASQFSTGNSGDLGTRNAMPLFNLAWKDRFFWDGRAPSIREQVLQPIQNPIEMHETLPHVIEELSAASYPARFKQAFGTAEITPERLGIALEQFLLTKTSYDSRFDHAAKGMGQLTIEEKRGFELFMMEYDPRRGLKGADCFHCHGGALFTDHRFHNNGLKDDKDTGFARVTKKDSDRNRFITPSLRNIALTAPYMHDGRFQTLEEVVAHYDSGLHRSPTLDPNLAKHPRGGLGLGVEDKAALVAFLKTLTDPKFVD
ncbi:MAG: MbnP family protein [Roseibacillus sp.]